MGIARASTRWITPGRVLEVVYGSNSFQFAHAATWEARGVFAVSLDGNPRFKGYGGAMPCPIARELHDIFWTRIAPDLDAFDPVAWVDPVRLLKRAQSKAEERRRVKEDGMIVLF